MQSWLCVATFLLVQVFGSYLEHAAGLPDYQAITVSTGNEDSSCSSQIEENYITAIEDSTLLLFCNKFMSQNFGNHFLGFINEAQQQVGIVDASVRQYAFVQPGLTGQEGSVSIRSCSDPTRYLRVDRGNSLVYEAVIQDSDPMATKQDATFYRRKNAYFEGFDAFESVFEPNSFLRHSNFQLRLDTFLGTNVYRSDASYRIQPQGLFTN